MRRGCIEVGVFALKIDEYKNPKQCRLCIILDQLMVKGLAFYALGRLGSMAFVHFSYKMYAQHMLKDDFASEDSQNHSLSKHLAWNLQITVA
jgi:hypothetical protein